jgi:hypothetical protein
VYVVLAKENYPPQNCDLPSDQQKNPLTHHDALEFPDGSNILTFSEEGQQATVLQLPVTHEGVKAPEPEKVRVS